MASAQGAFLHYSLLFLFVIFCMERVIFLSTGLGVLGLNAMSCDGVFVWLDSLVDSI